VKRRNRAICFLLAALLSAATMIVPMTAQASETAVVDAPAAGENQLPAVWGAIAITDKILLELTDVQMLDDGQSAFYALAIRFTNNADKELILSDYGLQLETASGAMYMARAADGTGMKKRLQPHAVNEVVFAAELPSGSRIADLSVRLFRWNFTLKGYKQSVGTIALADATSDETKVPQAEKRLLRLAQGSAALLIDYGSLLQWKQDGEFRFLLQAQFGNEGKDVVSLAGLRYYVRIEDGSLYSLEMDDPKAGTELKPKTARLVSFTANLPFELPVGGWSIVVARELSDSKVLPLAEYPLAKETIANAKPFPVPSAGKPANKRTHITPTGTFDIEVTTIERAAWTDQDLISASVMVRNTGQAAAKLPNMNGYFILEDGTKIEGEAVTLADMGLLPAKSQTNVRLIGNLPSAVRSPNVKVVVQDGSAPIGIYTAKVREPLNVPIAADRQHNIVEPGKSRSLQVQNVVVYKGDSGLLVSGELVVTNNASKPQSLKRWAAYLRAKGGDMFQASMSDASGVALNPKQQARIQFWTRLPKGMEVDDLQLVAGEDAAVQADPKQAAAEKPFAGFQNVTAFDLPKERPNEGDRYFNIIPGYRLSIVPRSAFSDPLSDQKQLTLEYAIKKTDDSIYIGDRHQLSYSLHSGSAVVDGSLDLAIGGKDGEDQLGLRKQKTIAINSRSGYTNDYFTIVFYDEFKGERRQIGSFGYYFSDWE